MENAWALGKLKTTTNRAKYAKNVNAAHATKVKKIIFYMIRYYGDKNKERGQKMGKEIEVTTKITIKEDGEILEEVKQAADTPDNESSTAAGYIIHSDDDKDITEGEAERYAAASDLANVCEYLEDSEVIKIKLIIQKAQARKERAEHG